MAKKWSGFVAQNLAAKEEWELLEASQAQTRLQRPETPAAPRAEGELRGDTKRAVGIPVVKSK